MSQEGNRASNIDEMQFEEALKELEQIAEQLDKAEVPLGEMLVKFERALALKKRCTSLLQDAQQKIEQLVNEDGDTEAFSGSGAASTGGVAPSQPIGSAEQGPEIDWTMDESEDPFGDQ